MRGNSFCRCHSSAQKKRIVFTTWGSFGDLHPFMAVALELQKRGHRAVIARSPLYEEKERAGGRDFCPVRPDLPEPDSVMAADIHRRVSDGRGDPGSPMR